MNLKELNEKRGAKAKEARSLIDTASTAKRELTAEERSKIDTLQTECETLDAQIATEIRQLHIEKGKPVQLSEQEKRDLGRFDYAKLLDHLMRASKSQPTRLDGIEAEMLDEGEKEARACGVQATGIVLPRLLVRRGVERRDMTTTAGEGGHTVVTDKAGLLDDFFNASILRAAGATVLEGLTGNLDVPRLAAGTTPTAKAENAAADEVSPTTAQLSLTPNRLPAFIDISEQLVRQSSSAIETIVSRHLTAQLLAVQEKAFFHGSGTNEANGIAGTSGIGSVAGGTNGLAPAWTHIVQLEEKVDAQNALLGNLGYISNGQIRKKLKETTKVASTDSMMILDDRAGGLLNGYRTHWTNAVRRDLDKGTSTGVCSAIFFGNYIDYWIAYWSGISLELIRDSASAKVGQFVLVANAYYDGGVVRPKSFAAMLDALGA